MTSLRAELVRFGTRWLLKHRSRRDVTVALSRQRLATIERVVPNPPAGVERRAVEMGGVAAERVAAPASRPDRHILYLHGGGYVTGSPSLYRNLTWRFAAAARAGLWAVDYRLAPEHPFPAALDDAIAAYRWLLASGADPSRIGIIGDSAGGGLAFALLLRLRDEATPLPQAAVALSPWTDLALSGASLARNAAADPMLNAEMLPGLVKMYLADAVPRLPYASPLYGDLAGLPPSLIHVGSDEILRDDAVRMAERLRAAGCETTLEIWPRMPHDWHLFAAVLPEARQAIARIGEFLRRLL